MRTLAIVALLLSSLPAGADPLLGLGTTVADPARQAVVSDDLEVALDWASFERDGYVVPEWPFPGKEAGDVFAKMLAPDYMSRTGRAAPADGSFEYVLVNVTGGDFNDVLAISRFPGDCGPTGCRTQLWTTSDGKGWRKTADFTAMGIAFRRAGGGKPASLAAIGDEVSPSFVLRWDGRSFRE